MATVTDHETLTLEIVTIFQLGLSAHRRFDTACLEERDNAELQRLELAAEIAHMAAFELAENYGWDWVNDEDACEYFNKATQPEILAHGLTRALEMCDPGTGPKAGPSVDALVALGDVSAAGKVWSLEVMHGSGGIGLSTEDFDGMFFATPDFEGKANSIAFQLDIDGHAPDIADGKIMQLERCMWKGTTYNFREWRLSVIAAIEHLVTKGHIVFRSVAALGALADFHEAAMRLSENWDETLDAGYPKCLPSFEQFVTDLASWRDLATRGEVSILAIDGFTLNHQASGHVTLEKELDDGYLLVVTNDDGSGLPEGDDPIHVFVIDAVRGIVTGPDGTDEGAICTRDELDAVIASVETLHPLDPTGDKP